MTTTYYQSFDELEQEDNMFDLKTCFLDLLRVQVNGNSSSTPKPKKSLKEFSNRYASNNFMKKYNDISIIHFNENMSMQSRNTTLQKLSAGRQYSGVFQTSPLNRSFENTMNHSPKNRKGGATRRDMDVETVCYDFSSDDRLSEDNNSVALMTSDDDGETGVNEFSDVATGSPLDSFCTLCTSSFSFNNCKNCDGNSCSSKCSVDSSCYCCMDRSVDR